MLIRYVDNDGEISNNMREEYPDQCFKYCSGTGTG